MPKLVAVKEIRYGGKIVKAGETFDVLEKDVKILKAIKKAEDPLREPPKTQKRPPKKADEPKVEVKTAEPSQPWLGNTYLRRDLTSED